MGPGEIREFEYSIRLNSAEDVVLAPTTVLVRDSIADFSNSVTIESKLCGNGICDINENTKTCPEDCPYPFNYTNDGYDEDVDNFPTTITQLPLPKEWLIIIIIIVVVLVIGLGIALSINRRRRAPK